MQEGDWKQKIHTAGYGWACYYTPTLWNYTFIRRTKTVSDNLRKSHGCFKHSHLKISYVCTYVCLIWINILKPIHMFTVCMLLGALLQMSLMTWDKCVLSLHNEVCFKQVAMYSLGQFYLYNFNGLLEQFCNQICSLKFLKMVTIMNSLFLCFFPLLSTSFQTCNHCLLDP